MPEPVSLAATASVIFIRIPGFTRKPVAEQAQLKGLLDELVERAVVPLAPRQRIVLDATEGAAIVLPGFTGIALGTARRMQHAAAQTPFCIGVDHGPLQVREDVHGVTTLVGDGLAAAVTVAEFAQPGQVLASRAFREALAKAAPESAAELRKAGDFTDSRVRNHELFAFDPKADARQRRRWLFAALSGAGLILALGAGGRAIRQEIIASQQPAILVLDIKPSGYVLIDGVQAGNSPPLAQVPVKAGPHTIEVRNTDLPPLKLQLTLVAGERMTVSHTFVLPPPPPPPPPKPVIKPAKPRPQPQQQPERPLSFWEKVKRTFGFY